jgi:hypothetical protein
MSADSRPDAHDDDWLEAAIDQAIAACGGDLRETIRALIAANDYLESEVSELMKAVSHAYPSRWVRGSTPGRNVELMVSPFLPNAPWDRTLLWVICGSPGRELS